MRGIRGRLIRLAIAIVVGVKGTLVIAFLLPTREHSHLQGADPTLMVVGAVPLALATYAAAGALAALIARRLAHRTTSLPRAIARNSTNSARS